jgi:hypothetical protein
MEFSAADPVLPVLLSACEAGNMQIVFSLLEKHPALLNAHDEVFYDDDVM